MLPKLFVLCKLTCLMYLSRWVHLLCALYTPDVAFVKPEQLQCVTLSEVPPYKWGAKVLRTKITYLWDNSTWCNFLLFHCPKSLFIIVVDIQLTLQEIRCRSSCEMFWVRLNFMVILFLFYLIRIVIFVKMRGSVGQEFALNAMLVCAGHIFTSHGECYMYQNQCNMLLCRNLQFPSTFWFTRILCFDIF